MRRYFLYFALVTLAACRQKATTQDKESPSAAPSSRVVSAAPPLRPRPAPVEAPPVPVEEDFEEGVDREISAKNVEQELDKLERELKKP